MSSIKFTCLFIVLMCVSSCASTSSTHRLTQAQLNAIETRLIDASVEEAFNAASGALFDAGYTIAMSDRVGGLLTGEKGKDNTAARMWVSSSIRDTRFLLSIQIRSVGARQSEARIKTSVNGESRVDKKAIDEIWTLMQRQVLMKEPPALDGN